jgi:hypothetical protein
MNDDLPVGAAICTVAAIAPQSLFSPTPEKPSVTIPRAIGDVSPNRRKFRRLEVGVPDRLLRVNQARNS